MRADVPGVPQKVAAKRPESNPSDSAPTLACARRRELRLSDSVSSGFRDKSANYGWRLRDRAAERILEGRCARPARGIRWKLADGTLEPVRCGSSNRCDWCAMYAALEAALVIKLDAEINCPTVGLTTTTRDPDFSLADLRDAEAELWRALRKGRRIGLRGPRRKDEPVVEAFPQLRYCGFLEWTTGEGTHAGGHRRPHIHHLVKGIPAGHPLLEPITLNDGSVTNALEQRVSELWHTITGDAWVVDCRPLRTPVGAIAYLTLHHHKKRQAPPPGFSGRRLRASTPSTKRPGYYEKPIAELRQLAQQLARQERVVAATMRAIGIELYGEPSPDEWEMDWQLTRAIVNGLRSMAEQPLELQLDLDGNVDHDVERRELVARAARELERISQAEPPELVRVREKQVIDEQTGETMLVATSILGSLDRRRRDKILDEAA
jgi:hypothetical protein